MDEIDDTENTFSVLVTTDNHLGYMERDPLRGNDSVDTFEEILQIAQERKVDFILLGGDLFHENKPSRKVLHAAMQLLRKYCFVDAKEPVPPPTFDYLSDPVVNFSTSKFQCANFQDPTYRVKIPVFGIHGNHDDPAGDGNLCAMDLLSVAGLVNHFGKNKDVDDVTIHPILLRKGSTSLAIYGMGNIRDERLHRTFLKKSVQWNRPPEDDYFNLLVFHQNRAKHGQTNYIPESFLEGFLHLVVWGHEHECLIDPQFSPQKEFYVMQPGSSVATALSDGESKCKHVAIVNIKGKSFQVEKIPLKTVRPFIMDELILSQQTGLTPNDTHRVMQCITAKVEEMLSTAKSSDQKKLPLIRLKVDYTGGFSSFNVQRFGQLYVDRVANPKDILLFHRRRLNVQPTHGLSADATTSSCHAHHAVAEAIKVEDLIHAFLDQQYLSVLPEYPLSHAIHTFVDKEERDAIRQFVKKSLNTTRQYMMSLPATSFASESEMTNEIQRNKAHRNLEWQGGQPSSLSIPEGNDKKASIEEKNLSTPDPLHKRLKMETQENTNTMMTDQNSSPMDSDNVSPLGSLSTAETDRKGGLAASVLTPRSSLSMTSSLMPPSKSKDLFQQQQQQQPMLMKENTRETPSRVTEMGNSWQDASPKPSILNRWKRMA